MSTEYEVRISVYRSGRRIKVSDSFGDTPAEALYAAHNDLERWADDHQADNEGGQ